MKINLTHYQSLNLFFYLHVTKIAKGECRGKRKFYFRMDYAEPHLIFVFTNVQKGIVNASFLFSL